MLKKFTKMMILAIFQPPNFWVLKSAKIAIFVNFFGMLPFCNFLSPFCHNFLHYCTKAKLGPLRQKAGRRKSSEKWPK